ncbi:protein phosphatase 2C domain-containing protein [Paraburkholderia sp. MMS20-SJTN17]|uniref:Protein phosphatase 2C domain-containing protein n=1 Tax=Paraburkholderia translucens TaxID=2886945 RepID=A0ABS8K7Q7_9BURK|nr:protein phosphatase 2C domain-containing protein [Paraburkholderia sp. MMS20-SJTN17]MCC8400482.1 protein phosphatase 2C domain-containing protein [Paraburkholderia sp. MMS20-SJTN17]
MNRVRERAVHEASGIEGAHAVDAPRTQSGSTHANASLWSVGQRSETGYVRSENQDRMSWIRTSAADIFVVSDGMGGHAGGAAAASLTVQVMQGELQGLGSVQRAGAALEHALQAANAAVYARGQMPNPMTAGMGATVVALLAAGERIMLAHVGDSRAYLLDRRGVLRRLTKDHSVVQRMIDAGVLTESEAANHPDAGVLERALGLTPRVPVDVSGWLTLRHGELCMLCSDGLCGYVADETIAAAMREGGAPQAIADRLVRIALEHSGEDNVTVQVLRCGESRRTSLRRWIMRSALALATLCAAAAMVVGARWIGVHIGERSATGAAANGSAKVSKASEADAPVAVSAVIVPVPLATALASLETEIARLEREQQQVITDYERKRDTLHKKRDAKRAQHAGAHAPRKSPRAEEPASSSEVSTAGPPPGVRDDALQSDIDPSDR